MSTTQVAFRLDDALIERIDAYKRRLESQTPGIEFTRADAARALLARALDAVEAEAAGSEPSTAERLSRKRSGR